MSAGSDTNANGNSAVLSHIIIIMFENRPINGTYGIINQPGGPYPVYAPYITTLADNYSLAADYYDLSNGGCGSITDYIAITSANISAINSACSAGGHCNDYYNITTYCSLSQQNIADRIEAAGLSWKAYMENMTVPCELNTSADYRYQVGHNPWVYYSDIRTNANRCDSHVIPAWAGGNTDGALLNDLNSASTPNLMWLTPNICNSMYVYCPGGNDSGISCTHADADIQSTCVGEGDLFLQTLVPEIMNTQAWNSGSTALFLTWDEATFDSRSQCPAYNSSVPYPSDHCQIPGIWLGPRVKQHYVSTAFYTHYSVLTTLEAIWELPALTSHDASANSMTEFFNTPDFTLLAQPTSVKADAGAAGSSNITVSPLNGFIGTVTLTDTVPAGLTCGAITPSSVNGSGTATVSCSASVADNYTLMITGTSNLLVRTANATFQFQDFSIVEIPANITVSTGVAANSTIQITALNGFARIVALATNSTSCTLNPTNITGSGNASLSCSGFTAGNHTVTISGTSGTLFHTTMILITVQGTGSVGGVIISIDRLTLLLQILPALLLIVIVATTGVIVLRAYVKRVERGERRNSQSRSSHSFRNLFF